MSPAYSELSEPGFCSDCEEQKQDPRFQSHIFLLVLHFCDSGFRLKLKLFEPNHLIIWEGRI